MHLLLQAHALSAAGPVSSLWPCQALYARAPDCVRVRTHEP